MKNEFKSNQNRLKFSGTTFSGGFSTLSIKQLAKINGGQSNSGCSNSSCNSGNNSSCNNTAGCRGSNNTGCTNTGGVCAISDEDSIIE